MALTQRGPTGATTRNLSDSPVQNAFLNSDPEHPGVVEGSPEELRAKYAAASRKVWPQTHGSTEGITTTDSLKGRDNSMTCAKCGSETGILVGPHRYAALCVQCAGSPEIGATLAPGPGDAPLPSGKPRLYPSAAMIDPEP